MTRAPPEVRRLRPDARWLAIALLALARGDAAASPSPGDGPEPAGRATRPAPRKRGTVDLLAADAARPPVRRVVLGPGGAPAAGALSGKTVYLSAGHGWLMANGAWHTQRGNTNDLVEDFITAELVDQYLIPYLRNMGAYVVPIREADLNPNLVLVDDPDATFEGDASATDAPEPGFAPFSPPIDTSVEPFTRGGTRLMSTSAGETGRAVFGVSVPETGEYNVYVAYAQGTDRAPDAHYVVCHGGGESHLRVDQRRHGSTWVLLGRWWFEAGAPAERSSIAVANDSEASAGGAVVSLDAVRLGGGVGVHDLGAGVTGRPAFETSAQFATQLNGAPPSVYEYIGGDGDDVVARPRFAAWEHEAGEDAVYLAVHTNAPNPSRGTMSIVYGPKYPCCGTLADFTGTAGSLELLEAVHDEVLADLRGVWDPTWRDAGRVTASLGELRPTHNGEMPAVLIELAFHDTPADADALRDPRFRRIAARAMAHGIARYFAEADGVAADLVLPPEPPVAVRVENDGAGGLRVSWRPPAPDPAAGDEPTGYRVYLSDNGHGFDDGALVTGDSMVFDGLSVGDLRYVRVAATNAGGESLPTETVGARVTARDRAPVLVVGGFDRIDGGMLPVTDLAAFGLGTVDRMFLDRVNDGTYAARHGDALAAGNYSFDGATDDAVEAGDVDLAAYDAVDWFVGEDSTGDDPLAAPSRAALAGFVAGGGHLMLSGSEVVWTLADQGDAEQVAFARDVLRVGLASDDAGTYQVTAVDGPLGDLAPLSFDDVGPGDYDAVFPDALAPGDGAVAALAYEGGMTAATAWGADGDASRGVVLGFPFEVVRGAEARVALMAATMTYFGVEPDAAPPTGEDGDGDGGGLLGGCGCRAGGEPGGAALWLVLVIATVVFTFRRRASARARPR